MKNKQTLKNTTISRVYKMALNENASCPICGLGRGCNRNRDNNHRNWKYWRKTRWKE
jgi:hypothetical protein